MSGVLDRYASRVQLRQPWRWRGQIVESLGQTIESIGPVASIGECCEIEDRLGTRHLAEVVGFRGSSVLSMPLRTAENVRFGDAIYALGAGPEISIGDGVIG